MYQVLEKTYPNIKAREDFFGIELARSIDARMGMNGKVLSCIEILPQDDGYLLSAFDKSQIEVTDG